MTFAKQLFIEVASSSKETTSLILPLLLSDTLPVGTAALVQNSVVLSELRVKVAPSVYVIDRPTELI